MFSLAFLHRHSPGSSVPSLQSQYSSLILVDSNVVAPPSHTNRGREYASAAAGSTPRRGLDASPPSSPAFPAAASATAARATIGSNALLLLLGRAIVLWTKGFEGREEDFRHEKYKFSI